MQTTINVTIGGKVFHVEEPAYAKLKAYLDDLHRRFATHEDGKEIVEDIEQAISGHMSERLSPGKEAITEADVVEMIVQMGGVDELAGDAKEDVKAEAQANAPKRLFRDMDAGIVAGVSAGLAAYFGIDVTIVRIVFVASVILGGWGFLVYGLLWLLVPEAKTVADKMAMSGEPVTVASIEESARAMFARAKDISPKRRHFEDMMVNLGIMFRRLLAAAQSIIGSAVAILASIGIIAATILGVVAFFRFEHFDIDPIAQDVFALMNTKALAVSGWVFVIIPLCVGLALGISLLKKKSIFRPLPIFAAIGLWIIAASTLAIIAVDVAPEIDRLEREYENRYPATSHTLEYNDFSNIVLDSSGTVTVSQGDDFEVTAFTDEISFGELDVRQVGETLFIERTCEYSCSRSIDLTFVLPKLDRIEVDGVGRLTIEGFDQADMSMELRGIVDVIAEGSVDEFNIVAEGPVSLDANDLVTQQISLIAQGPSHWELNTEMLTGEATGGADIAIVGPHQDDANTENFSTDYPSHVFGGAQRDKAEDEEIIIQ